MTPINDELREEQAARAAEAILVKANAQRTVCACEACKAPCRVMPGYLVPNDLPVWAEKLGYFERARAQDEPPAGLPCSINSDEMPVFWMAHDWLLASPGAKVLKGTQAFHIPTLVPMRQWNNPHAPCTFYGDDGKCNVHEYSPFGCRYFSMHGEPYEEVLSRAGLQEIWDDMKREGLYRRVWEYLKSIGREGEDVERLRFRLAKELRRIGR